LGTFYDHDKKQRFQMGTDTRKAFCLDGNGEESRYPCAKGSKGDPMIECRKTAALRCGSVHGVHDDDNLTFTSALFSRWVLLFMPDVLLDVWSWIWSSRGWI
jgi:hypothetical protein